MGDQSTNSTNSVIKQPVKIRRAEEKDIPEISSLASRTFSASFGYSMPASDLKTYVETAYSHSSFKDDLESPLTDIFIAYDERDIDHVMGFVQLTQGTTEPCLDGIEKLVELQRLYVDQNYHGRGVGRVLVGHVESLATQKGFRNMWLGVWEDNLKAQKVYERLGFKKVGSHDFVMGECVQTDWILIKSL